MAITALIRALGDSDKQIDEIFAKYSMNHPSHTILTETIFSRTSTALILINACGEATVMLNNLCNDANNNIDCTELSILLWSTLFKYINQAANPKHLYLILDIVQQLIDLNEQVSSTLFPEFVSNEIIFLY